MAEPASCNSENPWDWSAIMQMGRDPMMAYDESTPFDPATYSPHAPFRNRVTIEDARLVGIHEACKSFEDSRTQLVALAHLPAEAFIYAIRFHKFREMVRRGEIAPTGTYFADHPEQSLFSPLTKSLRDCMEDPGKFPAISQDEIASYYHVAGMACFGNPEWIGPSLRAFAVSVFFQCWQSFEVLTENLINEAVSNNLGKFKHKPPIEIRGGLKGDNGIRATYEKVFGPTATGIRHLLDDQHLDYALQIRNLFAHKSGKTDQTYRDRVKDLTLSKIIRPEKGEDFPLTGQLAHLLGDHCFAVGYQLIREVYNCLNNT